MAAVNSRDKNRLEKQSSRRAWCTFGRHFLSSASARCAVAHVRLRWRRRRRLVAVGENFLFSSLAWQLGRRKSVFVCVCKKKHSKDFMPNLCCKTFLFSLALRNETCNKKRETNDIFQFWDFDATWLVLLWKTPSRRSFTFVSFFLVEVRHFCFGETYIILTCTTLTGHHSKRCLCHSCPIFHDVAQISSLISTSCHFNQFLVASYLF